MNIYGEYREQRIGRAILKPQSSTYKRRHCTPTPMRNDAILLSRLCWLEVLEPRHRCAGMVSHGMGMAMREDHQIAFAEQHRLVPPFHGEPAPSSRDKTEAPNLPA